MSRLHPNSKRPRWWLFICAKYPYRSEAALTGVQPELRFAKKRPVSARIKLTWLCLERKHSLILDLATLYIFANKAHSGRRRAEMHSSIPFAAMIAINLAGVPAAGLANDQVIPGLQLANVYQERSPSGMPRRLSEDPDRLYPNPTLPISLDREARVQMILKYPVHWAAVQDQADVLEAMLDLGNRVDVRDSFGRTPLMAAAAFGSTKAARLLLARDADISAYDQYDGDTPIHFAASAGKIEIIDLLLSNGAKIEMRTRRTGASPLHRAAAFGRRKSISYLIGRGADQNAIDFDGVSPIFYASRRNQYTAVRLLKRLGARHGGLHEAINANDVARVLDLLHQGANVDDPGVAGTPLHLAAAKGYLGLVGILVDNGADLAAEGEPAGFTALHSAAFNDQSAAVDFLVDRGAPLDALDREGRTPLIIASLFGKAEAAAVLIAKGANPQLHDEIYDMAPIHWAAQNGHSEVLRDLLKNGVDINTRWEREGMSPLHLAASYGRIDAMNVLIDQGANLQLRDRHGHTAFESAGRHKSPIARNWLRKAYSAQK